MLVLLIYELIYVHKPVERWVSLNFFKFFCGWKFLGHIIKWHSLYQCYE